MINILKMTNKLNKHYLKSGILCILLISCNIYGQDQLSQEDKARFGKAQSLNSLKKYNEAGEILSGLYDKYPNNKDINFEFAKALGSEGKIERSTELFEQLKKTYPNDKLIEETYIGILESQKQFAKVREIYITKLKSDPDNILFIRKIADLSTWISNFETALNYYNKLLQKQPDDRSLKLHVADVCFWAKKYEQAIALYTDSNLKMSEDKTRAENLAVCYLILKQQDNAIKAYKILVKTYPNELKFRLTLAGLLHGAGELEQAENELRTLIAADPEDEAVAIQIADILITQKKYEQAITILNELLIRNPENSKAKLYLARILSWMKNYNESLHVYDSLIAENPQWVIPYREKARVLGWMRDYKKSIKAYDEVSAKFPDNSSIPLEGKAKKALYNFHDRAVIKYYKKVLAQEPKNLEALFDIGQAYSRQMQWHNALNMYDRILELVPTHFRAQMAKDKIQLNSSRLSLNCYFNYYEADSDDRNVDEQYYRFGSSVKMPFYQNMYLQIREDTSIYSSSGFKSINRQRLMPRIILTGLPLWKFDFEYQYSIYSDHVDDSHNYNGKFTFNPFDILDTKVMLKREDVTVNTYTLKSSLRKNNYGFRSVLKPNRRINVGADYIFSHYNDGNNRHTYGIDVKTMLFFAPTALSLLYRYEEYGYDRQTDNYFSPDSFHFNKLAVEWRHFLNSDELFWGTNDTYYTLRYSVNYDVHHNHGHTLYVDFNSQLNDHISLLFSWEKMLYEDQSIYSQDSLTVSVKIIF